MTDAEAKKYVYSILARPEHGGLLEVFARHALVAIEDRATLTMAIEGCHLRIASEDGSAVYNAASRHMKGEE